MYEAARNLSCLFWLKFEPFFGKIPTPTFDCLPPAAAGKNRSPASRDRQAGKNSFPLKPLSFLPARFGTNRGKFLRCCACPALPVRGQRKLLLPIHIPIWHIL
ncbi:MAG: hypothetical protein AUK06_01610 [Parcubacteria group bacterium CG2_30_36_18]|nr:MAG: hypothetical protein AUK06_01610 [Parcubacteria group bacterium CG2_30_36_18]